MAEAMVNLLFQTGGACITLGVPEVQTEPTITVVMERGVAGDPTGIGVLAVVMAGITVATHTVATIALNSIDQGLNLL